MSLPGFLYPILIVLHVLACLFLILLVLIQNDKGGGLAGALGGMSNAAFTGAGASNLITKITGWVAISLFAVILVLNILSSQSMGVAKKQSELQRASSGFSSVLPEGAQGMGPQGGSPIEGIPQVGGDAQTGQGAQPAQAPVPAE